MAITKNKFLRLVNMVLTTTWYTFNSQFHKQTHGVAVKGLPFSTTDGIYVQADEQTARSMVLNPSKVWERFIDDVYSILKHKYFQNFPITSRIFIKKLSFTMEEESVGELSFLHTLLKQKNEEISALVYKKPTDTDQYQKCCFLLVYYSTFHYHQSRQFNQRKR